MSIDFDAAKAELQSAIYLIVEEMQRLDKKKEQNISITFKDDETIRGIIKRISIARNIINGVIKPTECARALEIWDELDRNILIRTTDAFLKFAEMKGWNLQFAMRQFQSWKIYKSAA